jgi:molybdenum cofactor biosynthesis protein MoaC
MVNITHKNTSLRKAVASAIVRVGSEETIKAVESGRVPKGNVLESARVAALFGVKKTAELIPDCHPLPVEYTEVRFYISGVEMRIEVEVWTIYRTGVEVEAMHGASIAALTIYDMLKPIDKSVSIHEIKLLRKSGGKSQISYDAGGLSAAVIVCSDSLSRGDGEDKSGALASELLQKFGLEVKPVEVVPDDEGIIRDKVQELAGQADLIVLTGGTGLSPRDRSPEALEGIIDRRIPGMEEAIRSYGQERFPKAMFSRSLVGQMGGQLLIALPGSSGGVLDGLTAVMPHALHFFKVQDESYRHGK